MPWTTSQVDAHIKGLSAHQKQIWVAAANNALKNCMDKGGAETACAPTAIKIANAAAGKYKESSEVRPVAQLLGVMESLSEAGRVISNVNEQRLRMAIAQLQQVLAQLIKEEQAEGEGTSQTPQQKLAASAEARHEWEAAIAEGLEVISEVQLGRPHDAYQVFPLGERNMDPNVGGGVDRDTLKDSDYVFPDDKAFPIVTAQDVSDAVSSWGRYKGSHSFAEFKSRLTAIARRKGFSAELPKEWTAQESDVPSDPPDLVALREAGAFDVAGDVIPLDEGGLRADGTFPVKIIKPGWGTSGYYEADALKRDGPKIFRAGTHMYVDHPTKQDESQRPERSVKDLAAILTRDAEWQESGPHGPGLYAEGKAFAHWKPFLDEVAGHTGVSIRALGKGKEGVREGRKGTIVEGLVAAKSVDFVTAAGAGGRVLQLFESARDGIPSSPPPPQEGLMAVDEKQFQELQEAYQKQGAEMDKIKTSLLLREARDVASGLIGRSRLPEPVKARLLREAMRAPAMKDGELDDETFKTSVSDLLKEAAAEYEAIVGAGRITGVGPSVPTEMTAEEAEKELIESFKADGLTEDEAKRAAAAW